ncbi:uncharacterized protein LOC128716341 [Anopheles marshallii]|uniref:uncharacterized protein LOC128716341 n=1 Tax=Anopheles marshallii TaxID=1521116 RepID=UPI00237BAA1D|nr:uncharacterized protein LOC128716341 [Anopheles marshallii]
MKPKISQEAIDNKLKKLTNIELIEVQLEETRKFLSHFIDLLKDGDKNEENYFSTLMLCEQIFSRSSHTDRNIIVVTKLLNTILEIINRDYVSKRVVIVSLVTIHQIMGHLHLSEVVPLRKMLREKLPIVNKYFNEMDNFSIMFSIVGFIYKYVCKYDPTDRENMFWDVLTDFDDGTGKLTEMLSWPLESFNSKCRKFLNNIPGRKYFSLSARLATFGGRTILPRTGYDCISFEWNSQPQELSFGTFCFEGERNKVSEVSVEYKDITTLDIFSDNEDPRVVCEYGKMITLGVEDDSYQLKIACSDYSELYKLAIYIKPLIHSVQYISPKLPHIKPLNEEFIIGQQKLYDSLDFTNPSLVNGNNQTISRIPRDSTPQQASRPMALDEHINEESMDVPEQDTNFKPFDNLWKFNLLNSSTNNKRLICDPYDIAHMREEEKEQREEMTPYKGVEKRGRVKKGSSVASRQRSKPQMNISTPLRQYTSKVVDLPNLRDQDELSSIDENMDDEKMDTEGSDDTYLPYALLSKTVTHGRGNQKGRIRQSNASTRVPLKRLNMKKNVANKSGPGTGRRPAAKDRKAQQRGVRSGTSETAVYDDSCHTMDTTLPQNRGQSNAGKTNFLCERLNAKKTTTQTTTKVTTTKTTEVGIGECTEVGNGPSTETATLEDVNTAPPSETVPVHATKKVYTSLYKVEKRQEYRVQHEVNQLDCCIMTDALSQGDRAHILAHTNKIIEILSKARFMNS